MTSQSSAPSRSIPPLVIRSAIVASLGGLLFGFDTAVISGAEEKLTELYALTSTGEGMLVAIATIGTILGAIIAGNLADRFGRKPVLFWIGILFGVGALATALAPLPTLVSAADGTVSASSAFPITFFMIFRFLGGVGVGLSSVVAPIYTAEIAPARVRGRLVGLVQFNIVFGILLAYASNARSHTRTSPGVGCSASWPSRPSSSSSSWRPSPRRLAGSWPTVARSGP